MFDRELIRLLDDEVRGQSLGELLQSRVHAAESVEWARPGRGNVSDERHRRVQPRAGMVLCDEVHMTSGAVRHRAGEPVTADHVQRIQLFYAEGVLLTTVMQVAVESLNTGSTPRSAQRQK